jgi:SAM-dependent methyltransferase
MSGAGMSTQDKYDRIAHGFSEREYADPGQYAARRAQLVVELGPLLEAGRSVLDLGCGDGITAGPLLERGLRYTGVDASEEMVDAARQRHPGVEFVASRSEDYTPPEPVDATICLRSFYYPEDRLAFFTGIHGFTKLKFVFDFRPASQPAGPILADLKAAGFHGIELRPFLLPQRTRLPAAAVPLVYALERTGPVAALASRRVGRMFCCAVP